LLFGLSVRALLLDVVVEGYANDIVGHDTNLFGCFN
jgi:hypothetical protein